MFVSLNSKPTPAQDVTYYVVAPALAIGGLDKAVKQMSLKDHVKGRKTLNSDLFQKVKKSMSEKTFRHITETKKLHKTPLVLYALGAVGTITILRFIAKKIDNHLEKRNPEFFGTTLAEKIEKKKMEEAVQ